MNLITVVITDQCGHRPLMTPMISILVATNGDGPKPRDPDPLFRILLPPLLLPLKKGEK